MISFRKNKKTNKATRLKRGNKVMALICSVLITVPVMLQCVSANANNNGDTPETFSFSGSGQDVSDWRHKWDHTACYLYCDDASDPDLYFYIDIMGTREHNNYSGTNCGEHSYTFRKGDVKYMYNTVHETYGKRDGGCSCEGTSYAVMYYIATPNGSCYDDFHCLWSPDNMSGIYDDYFYTR